MPQPVKQKPVTKKKGTAKRPSSDPVVRMKQVMREMEAKQADVFPTPESKSFEEQFKARMKELGRKGGKASGENRMTSLTDEKRSEVALKAARARWAKAKSKS